MQQTQESCPAYDGRRFHLDRTLNVGHILTSLAMLIGFFAWANALDNRVSVNRSAIATIVEKQQRTDERLEALRVEMRGDIRRVLGKVDQIYIQTSYLTRNSPSQGGDEE